MKILFAIFLLLIVSGCSVQASGKESLQVCTSENFSQLNALYRNTSEEFVANLFPILTCQGAIDIANRRGQYVSMVGGLLRENPNLITTVIDSATRSRNATAPKIVLDALWLCNSSECRKALAGRPYQLPQDDVDALLKQAPPDPYRMAIDSPAVLDYLWGYFLGTGDSKIPDRILSEILLRPRPQQGSTLILTYGAARWSFLSMASQHEIIGNLLRARKGTSEEADRLLSELNKNAITKTS